MRNLWRSNKKTLSDRPVRPAGRYDARFRDDGETFHEAMPATSTRRTWMTEEPLLVDRVTPVVWWAVALVEVVLALRLAFGLMAASLANPIVGFVYNLSYYLIRPFFGIVTQPVGSNVSQFELTTLIAMILYALLGYLIVGLNRAFRGRA